MSEAGMIGCDGSTVRDLLVRPATAADRDRIAPMLVDWWGSTTVVAHGVVFDAAALPALVARRDDELVGVLTYHLADHGVEVVTLDAVVRQVGAGTALLAAVIQVAREADVRRVWLVTTNDNLDALRFYQRRGFRIVGVTPDAVDDARALKPSIPRVGQYGIELHDELTLELQLPR